MSSYVQGGMYMLNPHFGDHAEAMHPAKEESMKQAGSAFVMERKQLVPGSKTSSAIIVVSWHLLP